ncbi:hypothetical protein HOLleu_30531 [Holothuria leucospilota]|uniref:Uncharacterized protein n=1 Tax=Holothuria leucospilota TaxID=206669 RepID=A0A9Q1BKL1_HOLLE|nr:hypothetical protein HOLleu_30531 [Holothuria leucospilota]
MNETNEKDAYARQKTATIHQPMGDHNDAHNIPSTGNLGTLSAQGALEVHQQPDVTPDFIYLQVHEPPVPSAPVTDQALQCSASPFLSVVLHKATTNIYPQTTHAPTTINQGNVTEQQPPSYNELYGKGHPGFDPAPHTYQPQPWNPQFPPHQGNAAVSTQPQPMPSNMVLVTSVPQRNSSEGLAIASLVMAIIGIFCCFWTICCSIPGIVFAAISLGNSNDTDKARNHAKTSMTYTVIAWISGISVVVIYVVFVPY